MKIRFAACWVRPQLVNTWCIFQNRGNAKRCIHNNAYCIAGCCYSRLTQRILLSGGSGVVCSDERRAALASGRQTLLSGQRVFHLIRGHPCRPSWSLRRPTQLVDMPQLASFHAQRKCLFSSANYFFSTVLCSIKTLHPLTRKSSGSLRESREQAIMGFAVGSRQCLLNTSRGCVFYANARAVSAI